MVLFDPHVTLCIPKVLASTFAPVLGCVSETFRLSPIANQAIPRRLCVQFIHRCPAASTCRVAPAKPVARLHQPGCDLVHCKVRHSLLPARQPGADRPHVGPPPDAAWAYLRRNGGSSCRPVAVFKRSATTLSSNPSDYGANLPGCSWIDRKSTRLNS